VRSNNRKHEVPEIFLMFVLFNGAGGASYPVAMIKAPPNVTMESCLEEAEKRNARDPDVQIFAKGQGLWACAAVVKPTV
jgi:hypothetical protein